MLNGLPKLFWYIEPFSTECDWRGTTKVIFHINSHTQLDFIVWRLRLCGQFFVGYGLILKIVCQLRCGCGACGVVPCWFLFFSSCAFRSLAKHKYWIIIIGKDIPLQFNTLTAARWLVRTAWCLLNARINETPTLYWTLNFLQRFILLNDWTEWRRYIW